MFERNLSMINTCSWKDQCLLVLQCWNSVLVLLFFCTSNVRKIQLSLIKMGKITAAARAALSSSTICTESLCLYIWCVFTYDGKCSVTFVWVSNDLPVIFFDSELHRMIGILVYLYRSVWILRHFCSYPRDYIFMLDSRTVA